MSKILPDIPGISHRHLNCKICQGFDDVTLGEITIDIVLCRRTRNDIIKHYSQFLPDGIVITSLNINNHKRHSDPKKIAKEQLQLQGKPATDGEQLASVYSELVHKEMKSQDILRKVFFDRIRNVKILQDHLIDLRQQYLKMKGDTDLEKILKEKLFNRISDDVLEIDSIYTSLQLVALKDVDVQQDKSGESLMVVQTIVAFFQEQLRSSAQEMVNYIMLQEFANDPERGKQVLARLSGIMDMFLAPALDHKRLFKVATKKVVEDATIVSEK